MPVTSTVYEPEAIAEYVKPVPTCIAPFFHIYDAPVFAVNVTELPVQNVIAPPAVIVAAGKAFTVTAVAVDVAEQLPEVTVTV